jgi:hypothetical protein
VGRDPAILHTIVDSCLFTNNILIVKAKKCLLKVIRLDGFERITLFVARHIDFLDDSNLTRLIHVLMFLLEHWKGLREAGHLNSLIYQVLEMENYIKRSYMCWIQSSASSATAI